MHIVPTTLSLITTHQCTAACDHCCFSCTPKITKRIPFDVLSGAIEAAARFGSFKVVAFTGGECFLLGEELVRLVATATQKALVTRCVTNGYWAASRKGAHFRLKPLVQAGLKELNLSTGYFHQKYVPVARIIEAAKAAAEYGLEIAITVEETAEHCEEIASFLADPWINAAASRGEIRVRRSTWIASEGQEEILHADTLSRFSDNRISGCSTVLRVIAITTDLDVVACCGLHLEKIKDLHVGSLAQASLDQILRRAADDLLKMWIHVDGPERVYKFAKEHAEIPSEIAFPENPVHPCETCRALYADKRAVEVLRKFAHKQEPEIVKKYLGAITLNQLAVEALEP